jgi:hypothetical protein
VPGSDADVPFYSDLDATLAEIWRRLVRGAADRRAPFHTPQLASSADDGTARVRTVVLRAAQPESATLRVHTDRRSAKFGQIERRPAVELCFYDPRAKIQVRARGVAELHTGDGADAAWAATGPSAQRCYRAAHGPGTLLSDPRLGDLTDAERDPRDPDDGRARFAVVLIAVQRLEWLYLAAAGHRRAAFERDGAHWTGRWLAP